MNYLSKARNGYPIDARVYFGPIDSATISALIPISGRRSKGSKSRHPLSDPAHLPPDLN